MKYSYARVSTWEQNLEQQLRDLEHHAHCDQVFSEVVSGVSPNKVELAKLNEQLRAGDEVVVCKIDRLSRSVREVSYLAEDWSKRGIGLRSLSEPFIDTNASGKLMLNMFAVFAEFERERLRERVMEGLDRAKTNGKQLGTPYKLSKQKAERLRRLREQGYSISE